MISMVPGALRPFRPDGWPESPKRRRISADIVRQHEAAHHNPSLPWVVVYTVPDEDAAATTVQGI